VTAEVVKPTSRKGCVFLVVTIGALLLGGIIVTSIVTMAIWPGEAKLTAPLFCPDDKPDAYVVVDTYSYRPGETSYNYSLYCVGPRGEVQDVGWLKPAGVLTAAHAALILVVSVALIGRAGRRRRRPSPGQVVVPAPTPVDAPPVDAPPVDAPRAPTDAPRAPTDAPPSTYP
jgi:hypothetical protein